MDDSPLVRVRDAVGVAFITLDRGNKRNALSTRMLAEFGEVLAGIAARFPVIRAVVLMGEGPSFCAGADIKEFEQWSSDALFDFIELGSRVFCAIQELPQPVIAGIHGHALGGGLELALACDIRVADDSAVIGFPEIRIGGVPGWGGTVRLQEMIGRSRAAQMTLTGRPITAGQANAFGLVESVVAEGELLDRCTALAEDLASLNSTALRFAKRALNSGSPYDTRSQAGIEQYANLAGMLTPGRRDSVESFSGCK